MQGTFGQRRRLELIPLEDRSLLAVGVAATLRSGILSITGTDGADIVVVRQTGANAVTLDAAGTQRAYRGVSQVTIDGRGGNDQIYLDTRQTDATRTTPIVAAINGGLGNDLIVGGTGSDRLNGGDGADTIYGAGGNDWIDGGSGADRLFGNDGNDVLMGVDGEDMLVGGSGNDYLDSGAGGDWLYGGDGADTLIGGAGDDALDGGNAADKLYGMAGNDWLIGGAGDDLLYGAEGNDRLDGGLGNDTLIGGADFDAYSNDFGDVLTDERAETRDVKQGMSGTCVVLASLAAVADSGVDLSSRIQNTGANEYTVRLYRPGTGWVSQKVYFDGVWTDNDPMLTNAGDAWVLIYQRAYLQEMGVRWSDPNQTAWADRYGDRFQRADSALVAITGAAVWHGAGPSGPTTGDLADLRASLNANRPTIALTRDGNLSSLGLKDGHAYTVLSVQADSRGATTVTLRNPWGTDGPVRQGADDGVVTISWDTFRNAMLGFCVA